MNFQVKFLIVDHSVLINMPESVFGLKVRCRELDIFKKKWEVFGNSWNFWEFFIKKKNILSLPHFLGTLSWTSSVCQSNSLLVVNILPQWQNNSLGGLTGLLASWILLCSLKLECLLKPLPQILQDKGVSPVCTRTCSRSLIGVKNVFGQ